MFFVLASTAIKQGLAFLTNAGITSSSLMQCNVESSLHSSIISNQQESDAFRLILQEDAVSQVTQTQGGADVLVSGTTTHQELAEKEEKFKVRVIL